MEAGGSVGISVRLGRSASTVSREVARTNGPSGYRAPTGAWERAMTKSCKLVANLELRLAVEENSHGRDRLSRSQVGWVRHTLIPRSSGCHTKRSI